MKIAATYIAEDETYIVEVGEQQMVVPALLASKLATTIERAIYHQQREKMLQAQKLVKDAHHPAVLPFTERPETAIKPKGGRAKGTKYTLPVEQRLKKAVAKKKRKPPKSEPPLPFKHTPFR